MTSDLKRSRNSDRSSGVNGPPFEQVARRVVVVVTAAIHSGRGRITVRPEGPDCAGPAAGGLPDDEIFDKASNFLQQAVDETVQDPEFRALVTTMVLDRVGGTAEADVHTPPMPVPAEDDLVEQSAESRDWLLR